MAAEEIFDIVDEAGRKVGQAARSRVHGDPSLIHRSVHLLVLNSRGELYLQKRAGHKDIQPGKWDTSVGGHVGPGESPAEAVEREAAEELGLSGVPFDFLYSYLWRTAVETELVSTFLCRWDGPVRFDPGEITDGGFRSFAAIEAGLGTGVFTPNFEEEFARLKEHLERKG
ncbi:MAG: NUDIX domain-containing protein [Candidatus Glassbacteria bacterium]|nr:NUDIX domain-containing protein [Candidatus Glassbacteria bacterium]